MTPRHALVRTSIDIEGVGPTCWVRIAKLCALFPVLLLRARVQNGTLAGQSTQELVQVSIPGQHLRAWNTLFRAIQVSGLESSSRVRHDCMKCTNHRPKACSSTSDLNSRSSRMSGNGNGWTPLCMDMNLKYTELSCGKHTDPTDPTSTKNCRVSQQLAVARTQLDVLRVLKEEGLFRVDAKDSKTYAAALVLAAGRGHTGNVRCLLDRGVSVDAQNVEGHTALQVAATAGQLESVELLLNAGAAVDRTDWNQWTPLMLATLEGHENIVQIFISRHASLETQNAKGETALNIAAQWSRLTIARFLLNAGCNVDTTDTEGMTPLMYSSRNGQLEMVELLVTRRVSLEMLSKSGLSALHLAAGAGRLKVVRELLSAGADLTARDRVSGLTSLMYAAVHGHTLVVRELIPLLFQQDVDAVEIKSKKGCTALYLAAATRHKAVCELLLDVGGAAADTADWRGFTPLMAAAKRGFVDIIQVLLSRGANVEAVNSDGNRALEIAARNGRAAVVKLLLEIGAFVDAPNRTRGYTALSTAALRGRAEVVHVLLSHGANRNARSCNGDTPLLLAATHGRLEVVRALLSNGAVPNITNAIGATPLSRAIAGDYVEISALLRIAAEFQTRGALDSVQVRQASRSSFSKNFRGVAVNAFDQLLSLPKQDCGFPTN